MRSKKPAAGRKPTRARKLTRPGKSVRTVGAKAARPARTVRTAPVARARAVAHTSQPVSAVSAEATPTMSSGTGVWALALGAAAVMTVGLLIGMPSNDRTDITLDPVEHTVAALTDVPTAPAVPLTSEALAVTKTSVVQTTSKPAVATTAATPATAARIAPPAAAVVEPMPGLEKPQPRVADLAAARPHVEQAPLVTITGCLESDDEKFKLTDTTGTNAPKSRNWKTGFLSKRPAAVAVVDASGVGLPAHAGERVSLTGTLVERDMHVHSLKRLGASCE